MADDFFVAVHWRSIELACGKKKWASGEELSLHCGTGGGRTKVAGRAQGNAAERDPHLLTTTSDIQSSWLFCSLY